MSSQYTAWEPSLSGPGALISAEELSCELGADPSHYRLQAKKSFLERAGTAEQLLPACTPDTKNLQQQLTAVLHAQTSERLFSSLDGTGQVRLSSLQTPHAVAWTYGPSPWAELTPTAFRAGLRWVLGIPLREGGYRCPSCHAAGDASGQHAVVCRTSGAIGRGHTFLRDVLSEVCSFAGFVVAKEQHLPQHPERRPADLLIRHWHPGRDLALDMTIHSASLRSAPVRISESSMVSRLDTAAAHKDRISARLCAEAGWVFQAFPADTYGALHADSRRIVSRLITKAIKANPFAAKSRVASGIWRAISTAAVGRAARQLAEMAEYDSPLGLNVKILDSLAPGPESEGSHAVHCDDNDDYGNGDESMGMLPYDQPSSPASPTVSPSEVRARPSAGEMEDDASGGGGFHADPAPACPAENSEGLRIRVRPPRSGCPHL